MKKPTEKKNEEGFAIIITLVVLILLTLIVVAGFHNSILEVQIAGNDRQASVVDFSAKACARIKSSQFVIQNDGRPIAPGSTIFDTRTGAQCETSVLSGHFFANSVPGMKAGLTSGGYSLTQLRFISTGRSNRNNTQRNLQSVVQWVRKN